jgi:predicted dehydrogenase
MLTAWDVRDYDGDAPPLVKEVLSAAADPMDIPLTPFERQFTDFGNAVKAGRAPSCSGEEGYRALELVLSIYESCRKGQKVVLDG